MRVAGLAHVTHFGKAIPGYSSPAIEATAWGTATNAIQTLPVSAGYRYTPLQDNSRSDSDGSFRLSGRGGGAGTKASHPFHPRTESRGTGLRRRNKAKIRLRPIGLHRGGLRTSGPVRVFVGLPGGGVAITVVGS